MLDYCDFESCYDIRPSSALLPCRRRLPKAQHVPIFVAHRKLLHLVFAKCQTVNNYRASLGKLGVQAAHIVNPKESVPRASLLFDRLNESRFGNPAQHDAEAVPAYDGELRRRTTQILSLKTEHTLVVGCGTFNVPHRKIRSRSQ